MMNRFKCILVLFWFFLCQFIVAQNPDLDYYATQFKDAQLYGKLPKKFILFIYANENKNSQFCLKDYRNTKYVKKYHYSDFCQSILRGVIRSKKGLYIAIIYKAEISRFKLFIFDPINKKFGDFLFIKEPPLEFNDIKGEYFESYKLIPFQDMKIE